MMFVVLLGVVSLFADMTYEGGRSVTGPYLASLGASGAAVGFVAGFGELVGYALRLVSGFFADATQAYWTITFIGYSVNLFAVPALALTNHWPAAAALIVAERVGKAIRNPARDAMLSHAASSMGRGWGFALHKAMDQTGAVLGPLIVAGVLAKRHAYPLGFALLLIPAALALATLTLARFRYPHPHDLEKKTVSLTTRGFAPRFWHLTLAGALLAAGTADFALMAYHFERIRLFPTAWIPIVYAGAMGMEVLSALAFGPAYDRFGVRVLALSSLLAAGFAPCVFQSHAGWALLGLVLWGVGMGASESVLRAAVADVVPAQRRAAAYGVFNAGFGVAWFVGSLLLGMLYDHSLLGLKLVAVGALGAAAVAFATLAPTAD